MKAGTRNFIIKATFETVMLTAVILAILTVAALMWPWEQLPKYRSLSAALSLGISGLSAAIIEEILFRGVLQPYLVGKLGLPLGVVAVNLIFAPIHLFASPNWVSLCTFFPGIIMSLLKERYNSLYPPMLFHFLGNVWSIWFFPAPVKF